jgi:hypothetical protein
MRALAWCSIVVALGFSTATVVVAHLRGHFVGGVAILMLYALASWAYAVLTFTTARRRVAQEFDEELARRIGFVSSQRMVLFAYVLAPWAAASSAAFLMLLGFAIALRG